MKRIFSIPVEIRGFLDVCRGKGKDICFRIGDTEFVTSLELARELADNIKAIALEEEHV